MKLTRVLLAKDLYSVMLTHAYTIENQEIIGLLLGDWKKIETEADEEGYEAIITHISVVVRNDKRKDRVEVAPEQLHEAFLKAEQIEKESNKKTRVIGWYHSHPHITVFPSSIDLNTQAAQQALDDRFFGIIVSCFDMSEDLTHNCQIHCFQTKVEMDNTKRRLNIPLKIIKKIEGLEFKEYKESYLQIIHQLYSEIKIEFKKKLQVLSNNIVLRYLRVVELCTQHNLSLWCLLSTYLYPSLDIFNYLILNSDNNNNNDLDMNQLLLNSDPKLESVINLFESASISKNHSSDSNSTNNEQKLIDI
ncbi:Mov34-domain-containing protein [Neoconidiobolus thromboides FSU 785]|nr:Mov34-domain-containing protein [Neoconidiobolus thromboides FSU 785]